MRRWLKILLFALLLCAIITVGAAVWIVTDTQRLKPFIETVVSNATGRPLKINGELDVSISSMLTVRADNVDWLNPPWSSQPIMLHVDEIEVSVNLYSIKDKPITITNAKASGAQIFFEWIDGQPMNWDMRNVNAPPSDSPLQPIPLALLQAQLSDVQLTFIHPALPKPLVFDIHKARESQSGENGLGIVAAAAINGTEFDLRGEIGPFPELVIAGAVNYSVTVSNTNGSLKSRGSFDELASIESPDVELQYSTPDIGAVLQTLGLEPVTSGPVEIDARLITEAATIDLDIKGVAGEFKIDALLKTTSLTEFSDLTLRLSSEGPSARELGRLASIKGLPNKPYAINITADRTDQGLHVSKLFGKTEGFLLEGTGIARKLPEIRDFDLKLTLNAASLRTLGEFARIDSLPDLPFSLTAEATANTAPLDTVTGSMQLGETTALFDAGVSHKADFSESTLHATINSIDAREIINFYGPQLDTALPTELTFSSTLKTDQLLINSAKLSVLDNNVATSGSVKLDPELAVDLDITASGNNLNQAVNLSIPATDSLALPGRPWEAKGTIGYSAGLLNIRSESAKVGDDNLGFDGTIKLGGTLPVIDAALQASGSALAESLAFTKVADIPDKPYAVSARLNLSETSLSLSEIDATLNNDELQGSLISGWPEKPDDIQFDVRLAGDSLQETLSKVGSYVPPDSNYQAEGRGRYNAETVRFDKFEAKIGDANLSISGSVDLDPAIGEQEVMIQLAGPRLSDLGELEAFAFRPVPFKLSATIAGMRNDLIIRDFKFNVADSDLHGTISIDLRGKPTIATKLASSRIDIDILLARIEQTQIDNQAVEPAAETQADTSERRKKRDQKLLSDSPINFGLLREIDADFALVVTEFSLLKRTVRNLGIAGKLSDGFLDVPIIRGETQYGSLKADVEIHAEQLPTRVRIKASATDAIFAPSELLQESLAKLPRHNIVTRFTSEGDSAKELGAAVTGYFWMTGGDGELPNNNLSLLVGDLLTQVLETVNPFAKKQRFAPVACDAIYLEAENGIVQTAPAMIMQTDRLSIVAAGEINLRTEKIDIGFRTSPLKGIGVSASDLVNPFIKIGGSLANPALVLDPTSTAIQGGAAFMTMGASLLATSMWNRWVASKDACARMGKEATKIRKKINPDNMPKMPRSQDNAL